jgi:flagellar assembly factor FliW
MPLEVQAVSYGAITVEEQDIFTFPCGIIGFEDTVSFCLLQRAPSKGLCVLQSSTSGTAFAILDSRALSSAYSPQMELDDLVDLEMRKGDNLQVYVLITPAEKPGCSTVNLSAPLVVNRRSRLGKQVVQWQSPYETKRLLVGETQSVSGLALSLQAAHATRVTIAFP